MASLNESSCVRPCSAASLRSVEGASRTTCNSAASSAPAATILSRQTRDSVAETPDALWPSVAGNVGPAAVGMRFFPSGSAGVLFVLNGFSSTVQFHEGISLHCDMYGHRGKTTLMGQPLPACFGRVIQPTFRRSSAYLSKSPDALSSSRQAFPTDHAGHSR